MLTADRTTAASRSARMPKSKSAERTGLRNARAGSGDWPIAPSGCWTTFFLGSWSVQRSLFAGNDDSAERIGFGGRMFEKQKLILRGALDNLEPVVLADHHGEVAFHPLPYAEPTFVT
jgi:hypothetical protein